jgi:hypothetical protein
MKKVKDKTESKGTLRNSISKLNSKAVDCNG